jgi:flavin reductase (DIM6/NTAB) family NADH-FMN oxidoreductase RutF
VQADSRPRRTAKVAFPADKASWHPSVLPGPIVLVSTVDAQGGPNIAPKSFISMMAFGGPVLAFGGPVLAFGCHRSHATARNAKTAGEFVVNFPPEALAERIWAMPGSHGPSGSRARACRCCPRARWHRP